MVSVVLAVLAVLAALANACSSVLQRRVARVEPAAGTSGLQQM